jgi:serine/threonine-protein kinase
MQVLSALAFAHDNGIVHRDIKPGNIMVLANGHAKVADFGISRVPASDLTIVGDVLGTPAYMAPEQHLGAPGDHRADLFAAGVTLFEMLSGVKPFRGRSITEMISHMETRGPEDITTHSPEAPPALKRVIEMALAFDPEHRFANAAEFANNLAQISEVRTRIVAPPLRDDETVIAPPLRAAAVGRPPLAGAVLAEIEHELTTLIGPLARIMVQRAAKTCSSLDRLYQDLATYIADETDRAAFLSRGQERIKKEATTTGVVATGQRPIQTSTGRPRSIAIAPDVLTGIEANLAQYIGPIARVVVRRQLSKSASLRDLYRDLASLIPDERDRTQFLKSQPSG